MEKEIINVDESLCVLVLWLVCFAFVACIYIGYCDSANSGLRQVVKASGQD